MFEDAMDGGYEDCIELPAGVVKFDIPSPSDGLRGCWFTLSTGVSSVGLVVLFAVGACGLMAWK